MKQAALAQCFVSFNIGESGLRNSVVLLCGSVSCGLVLTNGLDGLGVQFHTQPCVPSTDLHPHPHDAVQMSRTRWRCGGVLRCTDAQMHRCTNSVTQRCAVSKSSNGLTGHCGRYFSVFNGLSEYGLSLLTAGRLASLRGMTCDLKEADQLSRATRPRRHLSLEMQVI